MAAHLSRLNCVIAMAIILLTVEQSNGTPTGRYGRGDWPAEAQRDHRRQNNLVDLYANPSTAQESVYSRKRGLGLSAPTLIFIVLALLGTGFGLWCCRVICYPYYRDQRSDTYNLRNSDSERLNKVGMELEASTATPSP